MRCRDVEKLSSAYIDGDLDDRRASALRGHLRQCDDCFARVEDEARLTEAAESLEPVEPPPELWSGIEERLAEAEVADAGRSRLWLWWQRARLYTLPAAVAAVAVVAALSFWARGDGDTRTARSTPGADRGTSVDDASAGPAPDFGRARAAEVSRTDHRYRSAIEDLLALAERERSRWSAEQEAAFDARLSEFRRAVREHRQAMRDVGSGELPPTAPSRDQLYAVYQRQIDYMQRAVLGEAWR